MSNVSAATAPARLQLLLADRAAMWARAQQLAPGWLTEDEQVRLHAMQQPARRQEFMACRYALRHLLSMTEGHAVEYWQLDAPKGRAPRLNACHHGVDGGSFVHLSLTHSGSYLACAVASQPVGIDLEVKDVRVMKRNVMDWAAMACTDEEVRKLQAIGCETSRYRRLLHWWSLKESYFKCMGTGVDFSTIRHIGCHPVGEGEERSLACARSWWGSTAAGCDVRLSVCVREPDCLESCALTLDADIEWQGACDGALTQLASVS